MHIIPTRRKSSRRSDLPNIRPCVVCTEEKPIVAHGMCDSCRKKRERNDNKIAFTPATAVDEVKGVKALAGLYKLMRECKVSQAARRQILERFLPFTGLPLNVQQGHLEALRNTTPAVEDGFDWPVHPGSANATDESVGRELEQ
jgi:hypothetical protein